MSHELIRSNMFIRAAKKTLRKNPVLKDDILKTLKLLEEDVFHPSLKTHKLTGVLKSSWACSVGYDLRIIFSFVKNQGKEAIFLETMGTHDEVY